MSFNIAIMKQEIREIVYSKCNGHCGYCGCVLKYSEMQVDHIIPKVNYISHILNNFSIPDFLLHLGIEDMDSTDNYMPTCRSCNLFKSAYSLEQFRYELSMQTSRLSKNAQFMRALRFHQIRISEKSIDFYFEKKFPQVFNILS